MSRAKRIEWFYVAVGVCIQGTQCIALCQPSSDLPVVTVCQLLDDRFAYSGMTVQVTGKLLARSAIIAVDCAVDVVTDGFRWVPGIWISNELGVRLRYGVGSRDSGADLFVTVVGQFQAKPLTADDGLGNRGFGEHGNFAAQLTEVRLLSLNRVRPTALSVCEILTNPRRYAGRVITVQGDYFRKGADTALAAFRCSSDTKPRTDSILLMEVGATESAYRNEGKGPRSDVAHEVIVTGRFEIWEDAKTQRSNSSTVGFGACACYSSRLANATVRYPRFVRRQ